MSRVFVIMVSPCATIYIVNMVKSSSSHDNKPDYTITTENSFQQIKIVQIKTPVHFQTLQSSSAKLSPKSAFVTVMSQIPQVLLFLS